MLRSLTIHNLVLIDDLQILFHPGMQVLTGETGAGKSIVVDSVSLILLPSVFIFVCVRFEIVLDNRFFESLFRYFFRNSDCISAFLSSHLKHAPSLSLPDYNTLRNHTQDTSCTNRVYDFCHFSQLKSCV